jgi:hypothetical protein
MGLWLARPGLEASSTLLASHQAVRGGGDSGHSLWGKHSFGIGLVEGRERQHY